MTLEEYMRELFLMKRQYGQEEELYPLVNMLLRETQSDTEKKLSIRSVHNSRGKGILHAMLYGYSSFPDLVILSEDYTPPNQDKLNEYFGFKCRRPRTEKGRDEKNKGLKEAYTGIINQADIVEKIAEKACEMYGCVECKALNSDLDKIGVNDSRFVTKSIKPSTNQLLGELLWYGKVLYTNGVVWNYLEIENHVKENCINEYLNLFLKDSINENEIKISFLCVEIGNLSEPLKKTEELDEKRIGIFMDQFRSENQKNNWNNEWNRLKDNLALIDWTQDNTKRTFK